MSNKKLEQVLQEIYEESYTDKPKYILALTEILDEEDKTEEVQKIVKYVEAVIKKCLKDPEFNERWNERFGNKKGDE